VLSVYEVYRRLLVVSDVSRARQHIAFLHTRRIVPIAAGICEHAAELAKGYRLHMADALIYAIAQSLGAELWTYDAHFQGLPGIRFVTP
jgi:predicted nucleic acid-binding protein